MATIKISRSDLFPVGTAVGLYPRGAGHAGDPGVGPSGTAVEEATVASDGSLEWTGATEGVEYEAAAKVGSEWRRLLVASEAFTAPGTLAERIEAKRTEVGA